MKRLQALAGMFLLVAIFASGIWAADDVIGNLAYVQGSIEVLRNGKTIQSKAVTFGFLFQNFDQIRVGKNSGAEIQLDPKTGIGGLVKIKPNSIITLDITSMKKNQKGGIDLLAGSLDLKIQKLTKGNSLDVRSGSAVMGVRGTTFSVTVAPAGDILLATDEGRVSCIVETGTEYFSEPGLVVQGSYDGAWTNDEIPVQGLAEFRNSWYKGKVEAFQADPTKALKQMAARYIKYKKAFNLAYADLQTNREILKRWQDQDMKGTVGSTMENMKDKKALTRSMFKGRGALFMLERAYLRLTQIEEYMGGVDVSKKLDDGTTISAFLNTFKAESQELSAQISDMNYYVKLFAKRNDGSFPLDAMTGEGSSAESLFDN